MNDHRSGGFTLIEMAIVLAIIGALLAGGSLLAVGVLQQQRDERVQDGLDAVEEALALYVARHRRLPCPADATAGDGRANGDEENGCADDQRHGVLPWIDLGLTERQAIDPWGRFYSYRVAAELALDNALNMSECDPGQSTVPHATEPSEIANACSIADIAANECACDRDSSQDNAQSVERFLTDKGLAIRSSAADSSDANLLLAPEDGNGAAYVVISHGRNGYGGYAASGSWLARSAGRSAATPANETPNANNTALRAFYVDARQRLGEDDALYFDDLVRRPTILSVANRAGIGPRPGS